VSERPYRPSNGTEGEGFICHWCMRCLHDRAVRISEDYANGCVILASSLAFAIGDPNYPTEWVQDEDGNNPRCKAFIEDTHGDDWEPPPPPDPSQLVLIADPTEDAQVFNDAPTPALEETLA
jgi:hypothetical protein